MAANQNFYSRRKFVKTVAVAGAGLGIWAHSPLMAGRQQHPAGKRVGVIGLDTSHSEVFTRMINTGGPEMRGYKVVAAYPHGSADIPSALEMKPDIIRAVKALGVEIVESIDELLEKVDVVLLESNDGRPHLEQALPVFKAGKAVFIDKPIAADYAGAKAIFREAAAYNVPVFSSSALRFDAHVQKVVSGSVGAVTGADVRTPAGIDPHHLDLAWYGIHGVEMLFTVMGTGCKQVTRTYQDGTDLVVGVWGDGRIGTVRGIRKGAADIAGTAFGEKGIAPLGPFATYQPLVKQIVDFFETGQPPVSAAETLEIFAFMHAADISKRKKGKAVKLVL